MNERIQELAEQATSYNNSDGWFFDKAKFAQLIVAECEEVLRLVPYNSDRDFGDEAIYQEAIAKHFRS